MGQSYFIKYYANAEEFNKQAASRTFYRLLIFSVALTSRTITTQRNRINVYSL